MAADVEDPQHLLPCAERSCDLVAVLLLDARGRLLLQERDEHAPVAPDQWGFVGGHVEPGEDRATGMRRELTEETGLCLPDGVLQLWYDGDRTITAVFLPEFLGSAAYRRLRSAGLDG